MKVFFIRKDRVLIGKCFTGKPGLVASFFMLCFSACSDSDLKPDYFYKMSTKADFVKAVDIVFEPVSDGEIRDNTNLEDLSTSGQKAMITVSINIPELKLSLSDILVQDLHISDQEGNRWRSPFTDGIKAKEIKLVKTRQEGSREFFEKSAIYFPQTRDTDARLSFKLIIRHADGEKVQTYRRLKLSPYPSDKDSFMAHWISFARIFGFYKP